MAASMQRSNLSIASIAPINKKPGPSFTDTLVRNGHVSADDMFRAIALQSVENATLSELLTGLGIASEDVVLKAHSEHTGLGIIDLLNEPPNQLLSSLIHPTISLRHNFVVWKHIENTLLIAISDPENIPTVLPIVQNFAKRFEFVLAPKTAIHEYHKHAYRDELSNSANSYVEQSLSCRSWVGPAPRKIGLTLIFCIFVFLISSPSVFLNVLFGWIFIALVANTIFKAIMLFSKENEIPQPSSTRRPQKLPKMSILVPLLREKDIVDRLIQRMARLSYPKELLEICLVYEEQDTETKSHLEKCRLPYWMTTIEVPQNMLQTKPRAMNYALDFCNGDIIGIYDAEDAPQPEQLYRVAQRFDMADESVACVQCQLDYYNSNTNWIARCFTIEYAILFRVVLPILEKYNLPIPLGGTSVFFKRDILEKIGRWDAQNVTEDADLGLRLHRLGYRCLWCDATTYEEANFRVVAWMKQRSRWLKGFLLTWMVHMRRPWMLYKQLGGAGFFVFQVQMLGTVSSFAALPIVLPMWIFTFGYNVPLYEAINTSLFTALIVSFVCTEIFLLCLGFFAVRKRGGGSLYAFVPAMLLYWPLGAIAAYKAIWEFFVCPTYWDKTAHGINDIQYQTEIERLTCADPDKEKTYSPAPSMTIGG